MSTHHILLTWYWRNDDESHHQNREHRDDHFAVRYSLRRGTEITGRYYHKAVCVNTS